MARRRKRDVKLGDYLTVYWPYEKVPGDNWKHEHNPPRPTYRQEMVRQITQERPHHVQYWADRGYKEFEYETLDESALIAADMTIANSSSHARQEQAAVLQAVGFGGPIGGGESRALKNLFTELGKPELVKHGWVCVPVVLMAPPTRYQQGLARRAGVTAPNRRVNTYQLKKCYLFKSPLDGVPFDKFVRLARLYKDDSGKLRKAVETLLANPEAHKEIEALDTIDLLANLGGK